MLHSLLEAKGTRVLHIAFSKSAQKELAKAGVEAPLLESLMTRFAPREVKIEGPEFEGYDLEELAYYDLRRYHLKKEEAKDLAARFVKTYEAYFREEEVDVVMALGDKPLYAATAFAVAEKLSLAKLHFEPGNFAGTMALDPRGVNYSGFISHLPLPEEIDRTKLENFIDEFHAGGKTRKVDRGLFHPYQIAGKMVDYLGELHPFTKRHPALRRRTPARQAVRMFFAKLANTISRRGLQEPELPEKFIFLPLQVHDDVQVLVHSPLVWDMRELVKVCLGALPPGYSLVVKEHPAEVGRYSFSTDAEISQAEKLILLPKANVYALIRKAEAVVTLNSTVGVEALTFYKPVVTLGNALYGGRGITIDVTSLDELSQALARAVDWRPDKELVDKFLYLLIFQYLYRGDFHQPQAEVSEPIVEAISNAARKRQDCSED